MANLSNSLIGLSLLSGGNFLQGAFATVESAAVRKAKAAYTTPPTLAPWDQAQPRTSISLQLAAIRRLPSIIDRSTANALAKLPDVQSTFVAYKALAKLQLLAEAATKTSTPPAERASLQTTFAKGLGDLQGYLASTKTDLVHLSFGKPASAAESVGIPKAPSSGKRVAEGISLTRDGPLPGIVGNEVLKIDLSRTGFSDSVTVNLATSTQPPTLDRIAAAINVAIASVPMTDASGNVVLDEAGNPKPRWASTFEVEKHDGKWGLVLNAQGSEKVAMDQVGAADALMVVSGQTLLDAPTMANVQRIDDPATSLSGASTLNKLTAVDGVATGQARASKADAEDVLASLNARAVVSGNDGSTFVVGTTAGNLGSNLSDGQDDLFLTKLDSEGRVEWQRLLGTAGSAEGAAISLGANGDVIVAGTVKGATVGSPATDTDMLVARFDASGANVFSTSVRQVGQESASAIAIGQDGTVFVGGKSSGNRGDAFIVRLDASGRTQERRSIDSGGSDSVVSLAVDPDGQLVALTREGGVATVRRMDAASLSSDLNTISLGAADARALAIAADGRVAVSGATRAALSGEQVNGTSGGRDGFVALLDADLGSARITYVGTDADDQIDSLTFMGDDLYAGGRTTGALDGNRRGATDGFVARIDTADGSIASVNQFGRYAQQTEAVYVSAAKGGATILGALGFKKGLINESPPAGLTGGTSLREGDSFTVRLDGGKEQSVTIAANETLETLAAKLNKMFGRSKPATVTTPTKDGLQSLRITVAAGHSLEILPGPDGKDALGKLGIEQGKLVATAPNKTGLPSGVLPGGNYGLALNLGLSIDSRDTAAAALAAIKSAMSMTQTAYRSLYWSDSKARLADGSFATGGTPYQQKQLANYQLALERLTGR